MGQWPPVVHSVLATLQDHVIQTQVPKPGPETEQQGRGLLVGQITKQDLQ